MEDIELHINRHDFLEELHFTIAYSPVPDDTVARAIGGVLATVHEITEKVIGERRIVILRDLGSRASHAKTAEDACAVAGAVLSNHAKDVPFALLYLIDPKGNEVRLAGSCGSCAGGSRESIADADGRICRAVACGRWAATSGDHRRRQSRGPFQWRPARAVG